MKETSFLTTKKFDEKKSFQINTLSALAMRSIGRGRTAALKLFSVLNLGKPVSKATWAKTTGNLLSVTNAVVEKNMKNAANEIRMKNTEQSEIKSTVVSFDCSWNSRGWQAKEGVVAGIAQTTGKIIDIVHKTAYCKECQSKQKMRDENKITSLDFMEWFIQHNCYLNHTGSPQVHSFYLLVLLKYRLI